jgi:hypothetical protein
MEQSEDFEISVSYFKQYFDFDEIRSYVATLIPMADLGVVDLLRWAIQELTGLIARTGYTEAYKCKAYIRNYVENQEIFEYWMLSFGVMFERFS